MNTKIPQFLSVDFYCGAGGTTRGLLDAGGYVICGIDKDVSNARTYKQNNPNQTLDKREPEFLAYDMLPKCEEYPNGQQDEVFETLQQLVPKYRDSAPGVPLVFVVCAPCQSFTRFVQRYITSDRQLNRQSELNLLSQTVRFIDEFKPEMVISENVASIKTGRYKQIWAGFKADLERLGYLVIEGKVCASSFGVPQYRRRSVMLACKYKPGLEGTFPSTVPLRDESWTQISTKEAIGHLPALQAGERHTQVAYHACRNLTELNRRRLMSLKPGEPNWGLSDTPYGNLSLACHRRLLNKGIKGFGDVYTRMHPDRPAPTLTTRFLSVSNGRFGHYDEQQVRGISLREGAILQSFPENYEFHGSNMENVARMIGNAVPPKLSAFMANWLLEQWRKCNEVAPVG